MSESEPLKFVVVPEEDGGRLDLMLAGRLPDRSRGEIQKDIENGRVRLGKVVATKSKTPVRTGITITLNDADRLTGPQSESSTLDIIHEDDSILAINKPAGMVVHPNRPEDTGTLVQSLIGYFPAIQEAVYDPESAISRLRPGIAHRLDKDTSGVIVVAKTAESLQNLAGQFHDHSVEKEYLTLVEGSVEEPEHIQTMMKRTGAKDKNLMGVSADDEEGRIAITNVTPEKHYRMPNGRIATLLRCSIETGRTHQIRVHCKHIGHPVLGDQLYYSKTSKDSSKRLGIERQLLHAARLTLTHPKTGKRMTFEAPLPSDFTDVLTALDPV